MTACDGMSDVHEQSATTLATSCTTGRITQAMCEGRLLSRQASPLSCNRERNWSTAFE